MDSLETFGVCGLTIDMQPEAPAIVEGDWITTAAGSRYLVTHSRTVDSRRHSQKVRFRLRCQRLARGIEVPADVRAVQLDWYPRARRCL